MIKRGQPCQNQTFAWLGKRISQIIHESKAAGEFELRYAPGMGMIFVVEFNPKKELKHISVRECIKGRTKTLE
jgi:hypothetical protein